MVFFYLILISSFLLPFLAFSQIAQAAICIGGGGLSITSIPEFQLFGNSAVSTKDATLSFAFNEAIYFEDMRGGILNRNNRFSLYVTATDFLDSQTKEKIDLANLKIATDADDRIEIMACDPVTQLVIHELEPNAFIDADDDGISNNKILITGIELPSTPKPKGPFGNFANMGKYSFQPEIELTIPAYTPAGTYQTQLTFTII